jgi:hypothetical protein
MIRRAPAGGRYCAACGQAVHPVPTPGLPEDDRPVADRIQSAIIEELARADD